jgi:hypothetical protein
MTKSEILEKVKEINETAFGLYHHIGDKHDDRDLQNAANLLYSVSEILDTVEVLISE